MDSMMLMFVWIEWEVSSECSLVASMVMTMMMTTMNLSVDVDEHYYDCYCWMMKI